MKHSSPICLSLGLRKKRRAAMAAMLQRSPVYVERSDISHDGKGREECELLTVLFECVMFFVPHANYFVYLFFLLQIFECKPF